MPPHRSSQYSSRGLDAIHTINVSARGEAADFNSHPQIGSKQLALPTAVPIAVGVVLVILILLMPNGFFLKLTAKIRSLSSDNKNSARHWFGRRPQSEMSSVNEKSQPTFVENHLEMLRAWQKPAKHAQTLHPLNLAKPDTSHQPRRPTGMTFQDWQERQRNANTRPNHMHDFKLTGQGLKSPAYWRKVGEEMEARKSWWEKTKDRLRK
ncbi:hypothetical protein M3J09_010209 [Ascochyta lentis]